MLSISDINFDILRWMDAETRSAFTAATGRRRFHAGQTIYLQGDVGEEMYRIDRGAIRLSVTRPDGREVVLLFLQHGDCFGNSSLIDAGPRPQTAQAITEVELSVLDLAAFGRLRDAHRSFDDALLKLLAAQMRAATTQYADRSLDDLLSRVIARILMSSRTAGDEKDSATKQPFRLSQSELAMMVGASRQHVNKVLKRLESANLIKIAYAGVHVVDIGGLHRLLEADCHQSDRDHP